MSIKKSSFMKFVGAAFAVGVLAGNAFSELDANIPFIVNVDATIILKQGTDEVSMPVVGGVERAAVIEAGKVVSIRHGAPTNRQPNAAHLRVDSRGNVNLNLPQNDYHNATVSLYSLNGRRVMHTNINETTRNFSRSNVTRGVYMLSVKGVNGSSFTSRLNHRGGAMNLNVSYGVVSNSSLRREAIVIDPPTDPIDPPAEIPENVFEIRVTADGYIDSVYTLTVANGENPRQEITLREASDDVVDVVDPSTVVRGSFVDSRDNQSYNTVKIGNQTWMAENLKYNAEGSWCTGSEVNNCNGYGRHYDWATAMNLSSSCNSNFCASQIQTRHQGICPDGWWLPNDDDWSELESAVGGLSVAARHLKAETGWYYCGPVGSDDNYRCEDTYGFSALPGGFYPGGDIGYDHVGYYGYWWSATESEFGAERTGGRVLSSGDEPHEPAMAGTDNKKFGFSVRCVRRD